MTVLRVAVYGHQVGLAALPGAPFTDCHDAIAHELWRTS